MMSGSSSGARGGPVTHVNMPVGSITTDEGVRGLGYAWSLLGSAWFEEPLLCEDIPGHARLAADLDIPIALGETLGSRFEFAAYLRADAVDIVQPDVMRVGA